MHDAPEVYNQYKPLQRLMSPIAYQQACAGPGSLPEAEYATRSLWPRLVLLHTLTALVFAAVVESRHYSNLARPLGVTTSDLLSLWWLLAFKTWLLLTPALFMAGVSAWMGRASFAKRLYISWSAVIFAWLAVDIGTQRMFGAHFFHYLPYMLDVLEAEGDDLARFAGDPGPIILFAAVVAAGVTLLLFSGWKVTGRLTRQFESRAPMLHGRRHSTVLAALAVAQLVGLVPVQLTFGSGSSLLRSVHSQLPVDILATRTWAIRLRGSILGDVPLGLRIVSLRVDPRGLDAGKEEVTLHNFSAGSLKLEGWYLLDDHGGRLSLRGTLAGRKSRLIRLAKDCPLELRNRGGTVSLHDAAGNWRHEVSYVEHQAVGGLVINFRDEEDFDAFSKRVNGGLDTAYREFQPRWLEKHDCDVATRIEPSAQLPDVLVIAVESLAHGAMSHDWMPRLDRWADGGLRLNRHYSSSNISHFGLYSLLYGRLPLFYDRDLDDGVRPQLCETLAAAGYHTTYIASSEFSGWRRMEDFLNTPNFDEVLVGNSASNWREHADWVASDRWVFAEVRRRLSIEGDAPQLIVVFPASTHYPYEFPPEFDRHKPSGVQVDFDNWMQLDREQLKNRYHNSVLFVENEVMKTLDSLDPTRTVIVVTGDHGESLGEDGVLSHGSRPSEVQLRVPFVMVGPGVPARVLDTATSHLDVLPTLLHALNGEHVATQGGGRDLLEVAAPSDRVLLSPRQFSEPHELLLIRGDQRLLFKIHMNKPKILTYGLLDERGTMELETAVPPTPEAADGWVKALLEEFERM